MMNIWDFYGPTDRESRKQQGKYFEDKVEKFLTELIGWEVERTGYEHNNRNDRRAPDFAVRGTLNGKRFEFFCEVKSGESQGFEKYEYKFLSDLRIKRNRVHVFYKMYGHVPIEKLKLTATTNEIFTTDDDGWMCYRSDYNGVRNGSGTHFKKMSLSCMETLLYGDPQYLKIEFLKQMLEFYPEYK